MCCEAMNSINPDLHFTVETQDDFPSSRLPTLDFEMWIKEGVITHSYFQKPTKTPYVLMANSAMALQSKLQILGNELTKRLYNILVDRITHQEILSVVEAFIKEMKDSGYCIKITREAVISGIKGWKSRARKRMRNGQPMYRHAQETAQERSMKEIMEKERWYKEKHQETDEEESPRKQRRLDKAGSKSFPTFRKTRAGKKAGKPGSSIKSVMFIPHTPHSELARKLRENEHNLERVTGNKVKIVERAEVKLQDLLTGNNPWKGLDCKRENCFLCSSKALTGKGLKRDCRKRGIIYEIKCLSCEELVKEKLQEKYAGNEKLLRENERNQAVQIPGRVP